MCFNVKLINAQGIGPKPEPKIISVPIFLDSLSLNKDLSNMKELKKLYAYFKKRKNSLGTLLQYYYKIDTLGGMTIRKEKQNKQIDHYVYQKFSKYRWIPAHLLNDKRTLVETAGLLQIYVNIDTQDIICYLVVLNERNYKVFKHRIDMSTKH